MAFAMSLPTKEARIYPKLCSLAVVAGLSLVAYSHFSQAADTGLEPPTATREHLTVETLTAPEAEDLIPLHYGHFMPLQGSGSAFHDISGQLIFPATALSDTYGRGHQRTRQASLPAFSVGIFSNNGLLIPAEQNIIRSDSSSPWDIILSSGKVWSEPGDSGWSRASLPFTLVGKKWSGSRNGVATFVFNEQTISNVRIQIAQEAVPNSHFDLWAQISATFAVGTVANREQIVRMVEDSRSARIPVRPWSDLEAEHDAAVTGEFDHLSIRPNITVSGLLVDGVFYRKECRTRFGPYPYCDEMRHAVYSQTKTLGALIAMLRLAEVYGPEVWDERISDYVTVPTKHQGWNKVTFRHALNMTTGIGDIVPLQVDEYVDTDFTPLSMRVGGATTVKEKLAYMGGFDEYPWEPGDVFRYRTTDTTILAIAMDRLIKSRKGENAGVLGMLDTDVFQSLNLGPVPIIETRERDQARRAPLLGLGMLPTVDQTLRLTQLLQRGGTWNGQQILHKELTEEAVNHSTEIGLPTGWRYREGGEAFYHMSLWRTPHATPRGCTAYLPILAGYGGNYTILLPGDGIALRFADGDDNASGTWDSFTMRKLADSIKPFC